MDWFDTGKNWLNKGKKWLETAGDMNSARVNPQEKANWMDEQQQKIDLQPKPVRPRSAVPKMPGQTGSFP